MEGIYHGECLKVMATLPAGSVNLIACDLPYGTTACHWDTIIPFDVLWEQYKRIIKPNGAIVLTASQPFTTDLIMSNRAWFRYELIWQKEKGSNWQLAKKQPLKIHENILVFYLKQPIYNPQKTDLHLQYHYKPHKRSRHTEIFGECSSFLNHPGGNYVGRYPTSVQKFARDKQVHPTQKPVALFEWIIKTYSNEGDTVLDNCMGSGTTGVAAKITNRKFIGIEKDKSYFDLAVSRIHLAQEGISGAKVE